MPDSSANKKVKIIANYLAKEPLANLINHFNSIAKDIDKDTEKHEEGTQDHFRGKVAADTIRFMAEVIENHHSDADIGIDEAVQSIIDVVRLDIKTKKDKRRKKDKRGK